MGAAWVSTIEEGEGPRADEIVRRRGERPSIGAAAATVESVRLNPELREALVARAQRYHETTSSAIRKALQKYLDAASP